MPQLIRFLVNLALAEQPLPFLPREKGQACQISLETAD